MSDRNGTGSACAACGAGPLTLHLRVAGETGSEGLVPSTTTFGTALSDIVRCGACGHMQLESPPSNAELATAYEEAESLDYAEEETGQRATARATLERIERYRAPGALLDLGCWLGFLLDEARGRGWEVTGVEPSTFASRYARERFGLRVLSDSLFGAELPEHSFDALILGDVIEHLTDPGAALHQIARLARPGAVLALALPDAGSLVARTLRSHWWSVIPTHVQYFTRGSVQTLLQRHGFTVLETSSSPKAFTVRYYLSRIGGYSEPLSRSLIAAARRAHLADRLWAPDFHDRMAVLARAPDPSP